VDVAQDVIIFEDDCGSPDGIEGPRDRRGGEVIESLRDRIIGRVAHEDVYDPTTGELLASKNQEITEELAARSSSPGSRRSGSARC